MRRLITGTLLACALVWVAPGAQAQTTPRFGAGYQRNLSPQMLTARDVANVCREALSLNPQDRAPVTESEQNAAYERYIGRLTISLERLNIRPDDRSAWGQMCEIYLAGGADTAGSILREVQAQRRP